MKRLFPLFWVILCIAIPCSLFAQGFDDEANQTPVDTPTGGNANASLKEIIKEPSKPFAGGGYTAHPILLEYFTEQTYVYTGGRYHETPIRYRLLMPEKTEPGKKYPLVVWLHGVGESDDDNIRQLAHIQHIIDYIAGDRKRDFYMLVTQCPKDNGNWMSSKSNEGKGDAPLTVAGEIMNHLLKEYPIDQDCVTVAGLSSGGSATWEFAARHNDVITAMAAFSSNPPSPQTQAKLKEISIWLFNSTDDKGTPIDALRNTTARLKDQDYKICLTEYPTSSHDSWGLALREDDAFGWLLAQKKGSWRSPLPGRPFSIKMLIPYAFPLAFPTIIAIIVFVIIRDKRLRRKRLSALQAAQQPSQPPPQILEESFEHENK
ncbi:MAG: alpha/beta hydrolase-fold protein [Planctomycetaceae bacterium]|nr:alpha/beta hydrolase-fold protein [Planctomycetaceae bacterium]